MPTHSEHFRGVPAVKTGRKVWDTFDERYFEEILDIILRVKRVYLNKILFNICLYSIIVKLKIKGHTKVRILFSLQYVFS